MNAIRPGSVSRLKLMTTWNEKAKALIQARGMKYRPFAEALDISESAFGHYLNGRRKVRIEQLRIIAKILQVSIMELIEDDPYWIVDDNERTLIDAFRALPEEESAVIMKMVRNAAADDSPSEDNSA